jgi:CheY-like chemotaxis protein
LVDLHGGAIQATSPGAGQGTTFTVQLPLSRNLPLQSHQEATSPEAAIDLRRVQILIVDDEPDARDFAVFVLQRHGAQVTSAASAQEALSLFEQIKPDILVTDLGMPETDGYSLLKQIRQLNPNQPTPAIALTAYASEEDRQRSIEAGFTVHIAKPVDPEDLLQAIQHILPCLSAYADRSHSDKSQDKFP